MNNTGKTQNQMTGAVIRLRVFASREITRQRHPDFPVLLLDGLLKVDLVLLDLISEFLRSLLHFRDDFMFQFLDFLQQRVEFVVHPTLYAAQRPRATSILDGGETRITLLQARSSAANISN